MNSDTSETHGWVAYVRFISLTMHYNARLCSAVEKMAHSINVPTTDPPTEIPLSKAVSASSEETCIGILLLFFAILWKGIGKKTLSSVVEISKNFNNKLIPF